ncbi:MAG: biopolymer transporter ExbD [Pseudomonadota bacterium]
MKLARSARSGAFVPLTPLVDVMLILLVFFMVTSTYLNLDMIPVGSEGEEAAEAKAGIGTGGAASETLLLRIDPAGRAVLRGQALDEFELEERLAALPNARVLVLPSGFAPTQALVGVMEAAARAGVADTQIVRVEARP